MNIAQKDSQEGQCEEVVEEEEAEQEEGEEEGAEKGDETEVEADEAEEEKVEEEMEEVEVEEEEEVKEASAGLHLRNYRFISTRLESWTMYIYTSFFVVPAILYFRPLCCRFINLHPFHFPYQSPVTKYPILRDILELAVRV